MSWVFPVALSAAVTLIIPLASISKVTSICGIPRGAEECRQGENVNGLIVRRHCSPCNT